MRFWNWLKRLFGLPEKQKAPEGAPEKSKIYELEEEPKVKPRPVIRWKSFAQRIKRKPTEQKVVSITRKAWQKKKRLRKIAHESRRINYD